MLTATDAMRRCRAVPSRLVTSGSFRTIAEEVMPRWLWRGRKGMRRTVVQLVIAGPS